MSEDKRKSPTEPKGKYRFWTPPPQRTIEVGAEQRPVPLPAVPLPLHRTDSGREAEPDDNAIGQGLYDYLRQYPDCDHNADYAALLRDAYPHYLADLGAQIVMLERKEVDASYIRRLLAYLKILLLLEPDNPALLQRLGMTCYELALTFSELNECRRHLLAAMGYFGRALDRSAEDVATLNHLARIDYLFGDYPSALRRWQKVHDSVEDSSLRPALKEKTVAIEAGVAPGHPLVDDLEAVGEAIQRYGAGQIDEARVILEGLEEEGTLIGEFAMPEFFYLLGMCRGRAGDPAGAFEAFEKALAIDPEFAPAQEGREKILEEGTL